MIDTCDPTIACWSEDGETFVVKDPNKFEQQIIPQFFKHSKFSSFVRQLNFYAFRKIKYADGAGPNDECSVSSRNCFYGSGRLDAAFDPLSHSGTQRRKH